MKLNRKLADWAVQLKKTIWDYFTKKKLNDINLYSILDKIIFNNN